MLVQQPAPNNSPAIPIEIITITGVKANPTEKGLEVILQTAQARNLQVVNRSSGNNFIADIPNAQLKLASGDTFKFNSEKPLDGITEITVINLDANTVRITASGETALPKVDLFDSGQGLIFGLATATSTAQKPDSQPQNEQTQPQEEKPATETPSKKPAQQDEPIELVVTGERDGYVVPNATTATRTDTPLRDIPQSIQVVPKQVLEDRKARNLTDAVETVSGVVSRGSFFGAPAQAFIIRGFEQQGNFRNGFRDTDLYSLTGGTSTIEQVEVLKGPGSVLFGQVEPGGIINIITRKPLSEPYYNLSLEAGNYSFFKPTVDLSGPLTADKNALYRFIGSYESSNSFQDFVDTELTTIAPSITLNLGDKTKLDLYYEYINFLGDPPPSYAVVLDDGSLTPRGTYLGYPDLGSLDITTQKFGYTLTHEFNDNLQIRNNLAIVNSDTKEAQVLSYSPPIDDRFLFIEAYKNDYITDNYFGQIDLLGKFKTGSISHQILAGFDFNRITEDFFGVFDTNLPRLDIFDPNYDVPEPNYQPSIKFLETIQTYGVYLQDQITLNDNFKLLLGGRYDWTSNENDVADFGAFGNTIEDPLQTDGAFSPRMGLVYQPSETVSLYASYSQSFRQTTGFNPDGTEFKPTRGTQYEVGVKADFLEGRLSTNLAAFHLTKTNVTTTDPNNSQFSIQTGEQRSQGIELDVTGEIAPRLKVIASYAYTDAEVTEDNDIPVGNRLKGVPENQASLWTTYEIQKGNLKGLGFGLGLFYVGQRQLDLSNSAQLDDYLRTDAAIYYRKERFNAAINIENLFSIDYARTAFGRNVDRGAPFTIIGSVSWKF